MKMNYLCIDIETTGLDYRKGDEIIELACAKVNNNAITESYSILCKPEKKIPANIVELTKINNDMLKNQPSAISAIYKLMTLFEINNNKQTIIIHNAAFDFNFIKYYTHNNFKAFWEKQFIICTLELSRELLPNEPHKLDDLKRKFNIKAKGHRALNDVLSTIKVYENLKKLGGDVQ
jgi:DNA polymerase III epsilon subunit family exonuclease